MMWVKLFYCCVLILGLVIDNAPGDTPVWTWKCVENFCQKQRVQPGIEDALSLAACRLQCNEYASLWPKPTGEVLIEKSLVPINVSSIRVTPSNKNKASDLFKAGAKLFRKRIESRTAEVSNSNGNILVVTLNIENPEITQLTLETDESYSLKISEAPDNKINATINGPTYFGVKHGLETLAQLIIVDDIKNQVLIPNQVSITDKPVYPYRGVMLDTSRNYVSVETIKRTIDGISASKLNTFHWHITDTQSFPYVSRSNPELSKLGAYSQKQIYKPSDVEEIVQYARERGVRVLPELDAPAHVGEGWQDTGFVTCFNKQPWQNFCPGPPCGQFDPTKPKLYDALEGIYKDIIEQFNPDIFHMGGDEVSIPCWNTTSSIVEWMQETHGWNRTEEGFIKLWNLFQSQALERFDKHASKTIPIILWTSTLTKRKYVEQYLPKDRYIIQVWTSKFDLIIQQLLQRNYRLILSNYDTLYLDCGVAGWVSAGNNWCSPYKGWQKIYDNSPAKIGGKRRNQFLGGEAALWTEQVSDAAIDSRIWPRAAALAERLWAEPETKWRDAEPRMLVHRERLENYGIGADALEPQWCSHYEENCPSGGKFNE